MHPLRPLIFLIVFLSLASCQNPQKDDTAQPEPRNPISLFDQKYDVVAIFTNQSSGNTAMEIKDEFINRLKERFGERILDIDIQRTEKKVSSIVSIDADSSPLGSGFGAALKRARRAGAIQGYNEACRDINLSGEKCTYAKSWEEYERLSGIDKFPATLWVIITDTSDNRQNSRVISFAYSERGEKKVRKKSGILILAESLGYTIVIREKSKDFPGYVDKYIRDNRKNVSSFDQSILTKLKIKLSE